MKTKIQRCVDCDTYTLEDECPVCGSDVGSIAPARFSPEDPYGDQRREMKRREGLGP